MLRNCRHCGRVLTTSPGTPCAHCLADEDAALERVQAYLDAGGAPSLADVARATALPVGLLRRLVRARRIGLSDSAAGSGCVLCGRSLEGLPSRLCRHCAEKVETDRDRGGPPRRPAPPAPGPNTASPARRGGYYSRPAVPGRDG